MSSTIASPKHATVNSAVAKALGYSDTDGLESVASRAAVSSGALAHAAYAASVLHGQSASMIAATIGVSKSTAADAVRAGRWLDSVGPRYAVASAQGALQVAREASAVRKHLDSLKGKALSEAIAEAYADRKARQTATRTEAQSAAQGGAGEPDETAAEAQAEPTARRTPEAKAAGALADLASLKDNDWKKVNRETIAALAAQVAHGAAVLGMTEADLATAAA